MGRIGILAIFSLLTQESGSPLHFLVFNFLSSILYFSKYMSCTYYVKCILKYVMYFCHHFEMFISIYCWYIEIELIFLYTYLKSYDLVEISQSFIMLNRLLVLVLRVVLFFAKFLTILFIQNPVV